MSSGSDPAAAAPQQLAVVPPGVHGLAPFVEAGVLAPLDVQLAAGVARLAGSVSPEVLLAVALASRAPRFGHVCVELAGVAAALGGDESIGALPWPTTATWAASLDASPVVASPGVADTHPRRPLVWDGTRWYLQRYYRHESVVATELRTRASAARGPVPGDVVEHLLGVDLDESQRRAVEAALTGRVTVVAGGPGTGKTRTIARLVAAAAEVARAQGRTVRLALAAPTGKAAARMAESLGAEVAQVRAAGLLDETVAAELAAVVPITLHRLLGATPDGAVRHHRAHPLEVDLVVADELSMVSLPLMARLLDAVPPSADLVLVGDPDQLVSVEAGSVLSDLVAAPALADRVAVLGRRHRFAEDSAIAELADAVRAGDAERVLDLLRSGSDGNGALRWIRPDDTSAVRALEAELVAAAVSVVDAAVAGDVAAAQRAAECVKVLAALRGRPGGVHDWTARMESGVAAARGVALHERWYLGRPVLVTANDPLNQLSNGDRGVVVADGAGGRTVALGSSDRPRLVAPGRLDAVETWWAMTVHKSQGSEYPHVVVSLPDAEVPVVTRELLYTAVTRAREQVTVVASEAAIAGAVGRRVARASGLRHRLA